MVEQKDELEDTLKQLERSSFHLPAVKSESAIDVDKSISEIPEKPLSSLRFKEFLHIIIILIKASIPNSLGYITGIIRSLIVLGFLSKYSSPAESAGANLATAFGNVCFMSVMYTVDQGYSVLVSFLHGAKKYQEIGLLTQKHFSMAIMISIPVIVIMSFSDSILVGLGQDPEISKYTGLYFRYTIPALLGLICSDAAKARLAGQANFFLNGAIQLSMTLLCFLLCYIFVIWLDMGFLGAAIAKVIAEVSIATILLLYIRFNPDFKETVVPWSTKCLSGWWIHFKRTITIGVGILMSMILYEFAILVVIVLNDINITAAHTVGLTLGGCFSLLPAGGAYAMEAFIGNAMGEGHKHKAQKFLIGGFVMNFFASVLIMTIIFIWNSEITGLLTQVPEVHSIMRMILYMNTICLLGNTYQEYLGSTLRSIGKEDKALKIVLFTFVLFGVSSQWILTFGFDLEYLGVWVAINLATYLTVICFVVEVIRTDWDHSVEVIQGKLEQLHEPDDEETPLKDSE